MKIILLVDVKNLGKKGSVVEVNDGMAQNMLFPQKKALPATQENMNKHMAKVADKSNHDGQITKRAEDFVTSLPDNLTLSVASNASGTLFKAISDKDVQNCIFEKTSTNMPAEVHIAHDAIKTKGEFNLEFTVKNSKLKRVVILTIN